MLIQKTGGGAVACNGALYCGVSSLTAAMPVQCGCAYLPACHLEVRETVDESSYALVSKYVSLSHGTSIEHLEVSEKAAYRLGLTTGDEGADISSAGLKKREVVSNSISIVTPREAYDRLPVP